MVRRWLVLLSIVTFLVHGAFACSTEDDLNPQPLPPGEGGEDNGPGKAVGTSSSGGGSSGTSAGSNSSSSSGGSSSGEPAPPESDAGDAGDAGGDT